MRKNDPGYYLRYKKEEGLRKVSPKTFTSYLTKYGGYEGAIEYLKPLKKTKNSKKGYVKVKNPIEIADYAKAFSPEKAAKAYGVSERTVYRYINKQK